MWRLLLRAEIDNEFPRQTTPIVAAVAEAETDGTVWFDTCFLLYDDDVVQTPNVELPLTELITIGSLLRTARPKTPATSDR